ncbi:OapC/ArvC family zinc-ribbon domain-containing protein [Haloarchaeobius sp. HRN-SO-5]|uniref:OapC/ArvC family zinc-ribbon domain-containing protein n=1 Tax=Haloarchaeobius sp. HRN-SO-5 TaxID=3446118 RepID=UPI003EC0F82E
MPHQCTDCGRTFEDGSKEMLSGCPDCGGNKFQFIPADAVDHSVEENATGEPPTRSSSAGAVSKATATVRDWVSSRDDSPSGTDPGQWPKSGTEDYETPAEKAAARADADASAQATVGGSAGTAEQGAGRDANRGDAGGSIGRPPADEDTAQANARSDVVAPDELPDRSADTDAPAGSQSARTPTDERERRAPSTGGPGTPEQSMESSADRHEAADPTDTKIEDRPDLDELREELNEQFESIKILNPGQYELNLMELYDREEYIISLREDGRYVIDVPDSWRGGD